MGNGVDKAERRDWKKRKDITWLYKVGWGVEMEADNGKGEWDGMGRSGMEWILERKTMDVRV